MENNKTAVEWLFRQLWDEPKDKFTWYAILKKAKEMEKEQIVDAHIHGHNAPSSTVKMYDAEQYYNETYGKNTNDNTNL